MAEEARHHHIPMEATSRFEKANPPAYKLQDARMIERGDAPESVRRRVAAVRTNAVHVPKRAEGRAHAAKAAVGWQFYSAAESATENYASGSAVVRSPGEAGEAGQGRSPRGNSIERDSDTSAAQLFRQRTASALALASEKSLEQPGRAGVTRLDMPASASSMPEGSRGVGAPTQDKESASNNVSKGKLMPNVEMMTSSRQAMLDILDEALPLLPEEMRAKLAVEAQKLRDRTQVANDAAERIESRRPTLSGAPYDPPRSLELPFFAHARKSVGGLDEVQYTRVTADGRVGALAFVDKGGQVVVHDWKNEDAVRGAMKLASEKWGAITLTGNDKYKELAVRIAAESGYEITNPELGERFALAKARVAETRQSAASATTKLSATLDPVVASTPGERAIALEAIHEGVDREARRETRQAQVSTALGDNTPASGDAAHPYRSPAAADAARKAAASEDNNPGKPIPVDPAQSQTIERAAAEQKKILDAGVSEEAAREKSRMEKLRAAARDARTRGQDDDHGQEM